MRSQTWVPELLQTVFSAQADDEREIVGGHTWRASKLGACPRAQYLDAVLGVKGKPFNDTTLRNFAIGHMVGWYVTEMFKQAGVLVHEELELDSAELDLGCHVDYVVGGAIPEPSSSSNASARRRLRALFGDAPLPLTGIELKTKNPKSVYWSLRKGEPMADPGQTMQAGIYALLAEQAGIPIEQWAVLTLNKAFFAESDWTGNHPEWFARGLLLHETPVTRSDSQRALDLLAQLSAAKEAGDPMMLPCVCFKDWGGKRKFYCDFYDEFADQCCKVPVSVEVAS